MSPLLNKDTYEFLVPGTATSLSVIRWVVTRLARASGLSPEQVDQLEMAVDEACANVVEHAYKELSQKPPLHILINNSPEAFTVDIVDQGKTFDFAGYQAPKFPDHWEEGNTRGVGLYIIQSCADDVHYDSLPNAGNRMRLVKRHRVDTVSDSAPVTSQLAVSETAL